MPKGRTGFLTLTAVSAAVLLSIGSPDAKESTLTVLVAAISFVPTKFDLQGNADRLEDAFRQARLGGAQIAVAPEGALDGYVVNHIIAGNFPAEKMSEVAIPLDHPIIERFQRLALELEMSLVFGLAERIGDDVYNCAIFIDHQGLIRGKYHKMQFAEGYDPAWWYNRLGRTSRAFDTPFGRAGILICNDRWNPSLARIPVLDGARFLLIPAMGSRSQKQDEAVLARGQENGVPIVEANVGVTLIVDGGKIVAIDRHEEGVTLADITIPASVASQDQERDRVEEEFLRWRAQEMEVRLEKTLKKLKEKQTEHSKS